VLKTRRLMPSGGIRQKLAAGTEKRTPTADKGRGSGVRGPFWRFRISAQQQNNARS
jgi:hypothetical protein